MITTLEEGRLLDVNKSFERNSGFTRAELIGHTTIELGLWYDPGERAEVVEQIGKNGRVEDREISFRSKWGRARVKRYSAEQIKIAGKQCLLQVCEDITLRKQMGEALRLSEERFSKAFRNSPSIISISTLKEGSFLEVNESFEKHTGYERNELLGRTATDVGLWIVPSDRASLLNEIETRGFARAKEVGFRAKSGQVLVVLLSVEPIELSGVKCLLAVGQDITDRKLAEEELRRLSGRLLRSQDEERRRIARDLHDSTGQDLVALATMLGQLRASVSSREQKSRKLLSECTALADQCIREVRTLSYVLHPPVLDDAGLVDAIRDYVKGFTKRSGIQVELQLSSLLGRMTRDIELALFRVVQESLTNIHRHSGSHQAKIRIDRNSDLTLEVSDLGPNPSAGASRGPQEPRLGVGVGVGIHSMQERVKLIGGRLDVEFTSHGATVRVTLPLSGPPA